MLQAIGVFDSLCDSHTVVEAEGAGEGSADLSVHGDALHITEGRKAEHAHYVAGLESEVSCAMIAGEGDCENLHGLVRTASLHQHIFGAGGVGGLCIFEQSLEAAVFGKVIIAAIVNVTIDGNELVQGFCTGTETYNVAGLQSNLLSVEDVLQVELQVFLGAFLIALDLQIIGISIVGDATGIVDKVGKRLTVNEFIRHRALHGTLDGHHLLCNRNEEYVAVLDVVGSADGGVLHELVDVQVGHLAGTGKLDVTHGSHSRRAAGSCQGVECGVESAQGETTLHSDLAVDANVDRAGGADGDGDLVRAEGEELAEFVLDGFAPLRQRHPLEEDLGGTGGLDAAVCTDALVDLGLGRTEYADVYLVTLAKYIGIRRLGSVGGAEHIQVLAREEGMAVDVVACSRGNPVV